MYDEKQLKIAHATWNYGEIDAASTSMTRPLFRIEPDAYVLQFFARVTTAFAGVTYPTVSVGITGDTDLYMVSQPISKTGDLIAGTHFHERFCQKLPPLVKKSEAEVSIIATFGSTSGNFSSLTAGQIEFVMVYVVDK